MGNKKTYLSKANKRISNSISLLVVSQLLRRVHTYQGHLYCGAQLTHLPEFNVLFLLQ